MRICAATMVGPGADPKPAWKTARPLVDAIVDTAPGRIDDFAAARNELLAQAHFLGFAWAIMLDCDERISWDLGGNPAALRSLLRDSPFDVVMVRHVSGTYEKERIFRLPVKGHYHGRTHEAFLLDAGAKRETLSGLAFDEVPKTPEQYRAKVKRDLGLLEQMVNENPKDPRWWYYLGDTHAGLGHQSRAADAFKECWALEGWDEESGWAAYRLAEILCQQGNYDEARYWCALGMSHHPGMVELPWLAGWCCYRLGQYQKAIWWEEMALALNHRHAERQRIGFRYPPALYEAPYDVLRHAFHALEKHALGDAMDRSFTAALTERQATEKIADPMREG